MIFITFAWAAPAFNSYIMNSIGLRIWEKNIRKFHLLDTVGLFGHLQGKRSSDHCPLMPKKYPVHQY